MSRSGSIISSIFSSYRQALDFSQSRYTDLYTGRAANAMELYDVALKDMIVEFDGFREVALRRQIRRTVEQFFGQDDIQFAAID